jgi:hypothetical protein
MADQGFKRKLAAILSADVKGCSKVMGDYEEPLSQIHNPTIAILIGENEGTLKIS